MDIQRIRNLTTDLLHTEIGHVYEDIEYFIGESGIMTHMLPNAIRALEKFLRLRIPDSKFWNGKFDITHIGDIDLQPLNEDEKRVFGKFIEVILILSRKLEKI